MTGAEETETANDEEHEDGGNRRMTWNRRIGRASMRRSWGPKERDGTQYGATQP